MAQSGAAALLLDAGSDATALAWLQRDLMPRFSDRDFAVIIRDRTELVTTLGADGIHLSDPAAVAQTRKAFSDLSIGATCPPQRDDAMDAAELGADYIAFETADGNDDVLPLVQWWNEMMTVPSVVFAATPDIAEAAVKAGADFIAVAPGIWQQPDPLAALQAFIAALG
jgi:thiamine-phosphate pyrophosphorylase